MTVQTKDTLKSYFNTGDVPTEQNYIDLIDSLMGSGEGGVTEGPGIDIVDADQVGVGLDSILLIHPGAIPADEFDVDEAGLTAALAAASSGDTVFLPICSLTDDFTVPDGVGIVGYNKKQSLITGKVTLGDGSFLNRLGLTSSGTGTGTTNLQTIDHGSNAAIISNIGWSTGGASHSFLDVHNNLASNYNDPVWSYYKAVSALFRLNLPNLTDCNGVRITVRKLSGLPEVFGYFPAYAYDPADPDLLYSGYNSGYAVTLNSPGDTASFNIGITPGVSVSGNLYFGIGSFWDNSWDPAVHASSYEIVSVEFQLTYSGPWTVIWDHNVVAPAVIGPSEGGLAYIFECDITGASAVDNAIDTDGGDLYAAYNTVLQGLIGASVKVYSNQTTDIINGIMLDGDRAKVIHEHVAVDIDSGTSSDGDVLTSDGAGGSAWETISVLPDPDAIHVDVAGEIAGITPKASPIATDMLVIEDSADGNNKKMIEIGDLPTGGGDVATDPIWDAKGDLAVGTGADTAQRLAKGTDGQVLSALDSETTGLKWIDAPEGGGGGAVSVTKKTFQQRTVLYDNTLAANGNFDVSGIDQTYDHLEMRLSARSTEAANITSVNIYFNNDTTDANYRMQVIWGNEGDHGAYAGAYSQLILGGANSVSGVFSDHVVTIGNYSKVDRLKQYQSPSNVLRGATNADERMMAVTWNSTSAINRISIAATSGSLVTGSRLQIIGIKTESIVTDVQQVSGQVMYGKVLLADIILPADATVIEAQGLDQTYDHLEFLLTVRTDRAAESDGILVKINNDGTSGNYLGEHIIGYGAAIDYSASPTQYLGDVAGGNAAANYRGTLSGIIQLYTAAHYKTVIGNTTGFGATNTELASAAVVWLNTAAINRLAFVPRLGTNIKAGSRLQIFGVKNMVTPIGQSAAFVGTQLFKQVLTGAQASFDLQNIPTGYDYIEVTINGRLDGSGGMSDVQLAINNDTTSANYRRIVLYGNEGSHSTVGDDTRNIAYFPDSSNAFNDGTLTAKFADYDLTTFNKSCAVFEITRQDAAAIRADIDGVFWESAAAITRLTFSPSGANFAAGTSCTIIGYKNTLIEAKSPILATHEYHPNDAAWGTNTSATLADFDATNATITFIAPVSGNVLVKVTGIMKTSQASTSVFLGLRESTTDIVQEYFESPVTTWTMFSRSYYLTGISSGSHTYKFAGAINAGNIQLLGGPTYGQFVMEVWTCP